MALTITQTLPTNELTPKIGCGLVYCLEESDYVIEAGVASFIPIVFYFYNMIVDGDTMTLHGITFTFTASLPANATEIQINGINTAANVLATLQAYPFFADNYTITQPNTFEIHVTANDAQVDNNYGFDAVTALTDSILINPFYPPASITAGLDAVVKADYIVCMDVIDVLAGEVKICSQSFCKPLNVFEDGSNKVCFDVQKIIEDYGNIFSAPPAPLPTISSGVNDWDWYDENFIGQFRFRFYNSYKRSDDSGCNRIIENVITVPASLGLRLYVANIILEPDADYAIEDFSFFDAPSFPIRPLTIHPEDYKLCKDTAWEWRVDLPVDLIQNVFGGIAIMTLTYNYTDGSSDVHILNFSTNWDGKHL